MPPAIAEKYGLRLPSFPGVHQCVRLDAASGAASGAAGLERADLWAPSGLPGGGGSGSAEAAAAAAAGGAGGGARAAADMRITYQAGTLSEADVDADPFRQFAAWFEAAAADPVRGGWGGGAAAAAAFEAAAPPPAPARAPLLRRRTARQQTP